MAQFKRKRNTISCDEGFSVEIKSMLGGFVYSEGARRVEIDSEIALGPPPGMNVIVNSIESWSGPNGKEPVQPEERERIIGNLTRALAFAGIATYT